MCDLIDLNSPDRKGLLISRLASPLIPIPSDTVCNIHNTRTNEPTSLIAGKRDSLENNPFDMVLHKTTEYIQKKADPFEVALEKALGLDSEEDTSLKTCSLNLSNEIEQKIHRQQLKMNKTLEEPLADVKINKRHASTNKISNKHLIGDLNNVNILDNDLKSNNDLPTILIQDVDVSILNQSVMNDTLFEVDKESNKNQIEPNLQNKMLTHMEEDKVNIEEIVCSHAIFKVPKLKRSFSQGEALSPRKSRYLNHISLIEPLRLGSDNGSSVYSPSSTNLLNEGFLKSYSSGSTVFSSLSNISSIPKLSSVSTTFNSSMMISNETINRTFLESCSSDKSDSTKLSKNTDSNKERKLSAANNSETSVAPALNKTSMSDLTERFNKLKARVSDVHILENPINNKDETVCRSSNDIKECVTVMEESNKCDVNNKLIDVDVFTSDNCSKVEDSTASVSDTSLDSVFLEGTKFNKSIRQEAKLLARTFEELALKTSSGSSIDDLITNNPSWTLELLPAFDDEAVENLIELPTSPIGNDTKSKSVEVTETKDNDSRTDKKENVVKVEENIKDLEMELVEPISTEKRLTAVTLLSDLKKLIKTEHNIEANKLLENLEKTLGVNYDNNTELLTMYLNATNNLAKSPQRPRSTVEIIKNVAANTMEHSHEDNLSGDSTESIKESVFFEDINFNGVNTSKCTDNQKYLNNVNSESKCETPETEISIEQLEKKKDENVENTEKASAENSSCRKENDNLLNGRMVLELLANIGKLLSGQTEEHPTLDILKDLGNVLNFASNNYNTDKDVKTDDTPIEIQQTPRNSKVKFENKTYTSLLSKSANRLSLGSETKKQSASKNFIRRSISVSQTPQIKNESGSVMSISKSTSQLKEVGKRYSSDPGFVSPVSNKKLITNNNKNEVQKDTRTKTAKTVELQNEKSSTINTVKNKLKKKIGNDVINKKGPLKAILPIRSMQKRDAVSKRLSSFGGPTTPPQSHKIVSSTPNSTNNGLTVKKSRSSKPVASSTPDAQNCKMRKVQSPVANSPKKRNFSCDISPVTARINVSNNSKANNSPQRSSKLTSPKKTTPKRRPTESGIPKSQTPPVTKRLNSSFDVNQYQRIYESPQRSVQKTSNSQKNSPVSVKKNENNVQLSPLRDSNKFINKVKPINLISKLRRHSIASNVMEKENNYI